MSLNEHSNGLVWKRPTNCSESEDEVWDDRALINAYDRAVAKVNAKIANKEVTKQHKSNNSSNETNKTLINNNSNNDWHLGQYCRTVYTEDGIEYESQIISINPQNNSCVVKYIGYGNEEEKPFNELKPSLGKKARKLQSQLFERQNMNNSNSDTDQDINCLTHKSNNDSKQNKSSSTSPWFMPSSSNSTPQPIVPPPLPFCAESSMPNDDESLASMLMSWYMSGYHTGYYRASKQFKHNNNCKCNK
jgi:survival motor neuron protein